MKQSNFSKVRVRWFALAFGLVLFQLPLIALAQDEGGDTEVVPIHEEADEDRPEGFSEAGEAWGSSVGGGLVGGAGEGTSHDGEGGAQVRIDSTQYRVEAGEGDSTSGHIIDDEARASARIGGSGGGEAGEEGDLMLGAEARARLTRLFVTNPDGFGYAIGGTGEIDLGASLNSVDESHAAVNATFDALGLSYAGDALRLYLTAGVGAHLELNEDGHNVNLNADAKARVQTEHVDLTLRGQHAFVGDEYTRASAIVNVRPSASSRLRFGPEYTYERRESDREGVDVQHGHTFGLSASYAF